MAGKFDAVAEMIARTHTQMEIDFAAIEALAKGNKTEAKILDLARTMHIILTGAEKIRKGKK